jgi:pimeloyl-ACP methyl ester carboxylesterase
MEKPDTLPPVHHRRIEIDGIDTFYRECGPADAPAVLLPHGYPCSSFEFRQLMPLLGDRWRLLAPDFPGTGFTATPPDFDYSFGGYAAFLRRFTDHLGVGRCVLWLHDFGTWIGLKYAMQRPDLVAGVIVQNGDIYEDLLGDKYAALLESLRLPQDQAMRKLREGISREEFQREFLNGTPPAFADRMPPELLALHWSVMTEERKDIAARVIYGWRENFAWFPKYQAWLREYRPPAVIVWGPHDGYMPEKSARGWLRDLPDAQLHLLDAGHWLLETHLAQAASHVRAFLSAHHAA